MFLTISAGVVGRLWRRDAWSFMMAPSSGGPEGILEVLVSMAVTKAQRRAVGVTRGLDFTATQECLPCSVRIAAPPQTPVA